ncbi:hypothetical protein MWN34_06195 [Ancylobacter sp. 6x-1]|uniref:Integrase n=1 Tax=Ancylobacter crimeensis TaxID=2579147 RepID=A0ABT0D972_9HYPH|nr:DUF6538 domain-containing protein [Ancylobacter crimeensis]MCK0196501.1 hypothetical protein [Ancylobacter crimeensis]
MVKKPSSDTLYLQRIGARWYARIPVPYALREEMGPYFRKALGTTDLQEARHRRWDVLAIARAEFERRTAKASGNKTGRLAPRSTDYAAFRARLAAVGPPKVVNALDGEEMDNPALEAIADELEAAEERGEHVETGWNALSDHVKDRLPVSELLDDYLAKNPKANPTTTANYRGTVSLWIGERKDRPLNGVTKKQATEWLEKVSEGRSRETIKRYVNHMAALWAWAHRKEEAPPANPFEGLRQSMGVIGKAPESYEAFAEAELKAVFGVLKDQPDLKALALISLYSGMRLSECLRAQREEIEGIDCYVLAAGKTVNAKRIVPVHPCSKA